MLCLFVDMNLRDVWSEWTKGVPLGGGLMEAPLKELEAQKDTAPYKDPLDLGLKTKVARRRHIAERIEKEIKNCRFVLN